MRLAQALGKRGGSSGHRKSLQVGDLEFDTTTLQAQRAGVALELNPIQRKLLEHLMRNTHRVVPRAELEALIWKDDLPDKDILRSHVYSLRNQIDKPFPVKLLHTIHGSGYRLTTELDNDDS